MAVGRVFPVILSWKPRDRLLWDCLHHQCMFVAGRARAPPFENIH